MKSNCFPNRIVTRYRTLVNPVTAQKWLAFVLDLMARYQVMTRAGECLGALQQSIERVEDGYLPADEVDSLGRAVFPFLSGGLASGGQGARHKHLQLLAPALTQSHVIFEYLLRIDRHTDYSGTDSGMMLTTAVDQSIPRSDAHPLL